MGQQQTRSEVWTPANIVTIIRICLVPVFVVVLLAPWNHFFDVSDGVKGLIAAAIFILISCTDWIDGYLARSRNEVTDFGKFMDPLADKILVTAALISLVELQVLPAWPVLIILAREFIVSGVRMVAASKGSVIAASWYGKAKTVSQIFAIICFLVKDSFFPEASGALFVVSWTVMVVALVLTIISMMDYLSKARHLLGFKPSRNAKDGNGTPARSTASLAQAVIAKAADAHVTISTAESLTGGLIGAALTSVPGSSSVFLGGIMSYANEAKENLLGVNPSDLAQLGPVSEQVACQMAQGARARLNSQIAVAVTGVAGPDGGSEATPVGTVCFAISTPSETRSFTQCFKGSREEVRQATVISALQALEEALC
ncbi:MAG: CDP-diacylglycerol--glycerol-3-phosphate 3-phosphatidyltransferase [Eggerthellaceae bacterium]|nr:CDP-diacylglycerol--glycerol-3-phosphate 3-phosphatidyltransferase [Eggerthellaceae bacterium]